jgi:hypothetical protein
MDARGARDARVPDEPARRAIDAPARREENIHPSQGIKLNALDRTERPLAIA